MRHPKLVLAIFILSGAAGLMYEVVWSRQLVLVFGNTTQAVSTILTGFFGGLAIGSFLGGRLADRVRSPLRLYGIIELVLVIIVLLTPVTFRLLHEVYRGVFPTIEGAPAALALLRFVLAILALAPATVLMGATLPTLTRHLSRDRHLSAAFGRLYAANTLGAIVGTLAAGLVLIEVFGLTGTLVIGAACSAMAGAVAILLSRNADEAAAAPASGATAWREPAWTPNLSVTAASRRPTLALLLAFVSGLTSLGYQVLWTRLLSSGTGNSTYVFTLILGMFLIGITIGATLFALSRRWIRQPIALIAIAQVVVAAIAIAGLVLVIGQPGTIDPRKPLESAEAILLPILFVVLPATIVMGFTFPAASTLLGNDPARIAANAGRLLAANTAGAIGATFAIPFFVIPLVGSPVAVALLALVNIATALALVASRTGRASLPSIARLGTGIAAVLVSGATVIGLATPGAIVDPSVARIHDARAILFASHEDEIASVQAGATVTPQLWVTGTAMTLLTVDAKLMPVLPLMLRPDSRSALTVAFGMGSAFRGALIAGLTTEAIELVPTVPEMFSYFYADAAAVLANPNGKVIITDGRNHVELTTERYDIIVTDPPPPIFSSGASVISSLEYYRAGHARLNPGGIMMQWVPNGATIDEFRAHVRTFRTVFPHVSMVFGPGGYGLYMMGSDQPLVFDDAAMREVLGRPGILDDISSAYDSPATTVDDWISRIGQLRWIADAEVDTFTGPGPLITDDHPLPEYFLLRRIFNQDVPETSPDMLLRLTGR
ncbi:MAG: fused MFS/spermidine synthase [Chloroflexi bacterium]|nr:fused MFS/spermidine synthase [Chloroflexota bacterium]